MQLKLFQYSVLIALAAIFCSADDADSKAVPTSIGDPTPTDSLAVVSTLDQQQSGSNNVPSPTPTAQAQIDPVKAVTEALPAQIILQACPEALGNEPKPCVDCGGDSKVSGVCDNLLVSGDQSSCDRKNPICNGFHCKCAHGGAPAPAKQHTVLAAVGDKTATGFYEPMTLTKYKNLGAMTSVTVTTTEDSKATEAAVLIFAGGVAWSLASYAGAAEAAVLLRPPTERPEGSEEDRKECKKDPKQQCSDCGGADSVQLCKSGNEAGCPCDENKCPKDPPKCESNDCGGADSNSKCESDSLKGCQCCPNTLPECPIKACDGKDEKCTTDLLKGCSCENFPEAAYPEVGDFDAYSLDIKIINTQIDEIVKKYYGGDPVKFIEHEKDFKIEDIWCEPHPRDSGVDPSLVDQLAQVFCDTFKTDFGKDETVKLSGVDIKKPEMSPGFSIVFDWKKHSGQCAKSCVDIISAMNKRCQYTSHLFNRAAGYQSDCGSYNITIISPPTNQPPEPPKAAPKPVSGNVCNPAPIWTFTRQIAMNAITRYCYNNRELITTDPAKKSHVEFYYDDRNNKKFEFCKDSRDSISHNLGCSLTKRITITAGYADDEPQKDCPPKKEGAVVRAKDCYNKFMGIVDNCDTTTVDKKAGGTLYEVASEGCLQYSIVGSIPGAIS